MINRPRRFAAFVELQALKHDVRSVLLQSLSFTNIAAPLQVQDVVIVTNSGSSSDLALLPHLLLPLRAYIFAPQPYSNPRIEPFDCPPSTSSSSSSFSDAVTHGEVGGEQLGQGWECAPEMAMQEQVRRVLASDSCRTSHVSQALCSLARAFIMPASYRGLRNQSRSPPAAPLHNRHPVTSAAVRLHRVRM